MMSDNEDPATTVATTTTTTSSGGICASTMSTLEDKMTQMVDMMYQLVQRMPATTTNLTPGIRPNPASNAPMSQLSHPTASPRKPVNCNILKTLCPKKLDTDLDLDTATPRIQHS